MSQQGQAIRWKRPAGTLTCHSQCWSPTPGFGLCLQLPEGRWAMFQLSSICHSCGRTRLGFLVPASAGVLTLFAPVLWLFVEQISRRARSILFFLSLFLSCSLPPTKTTQTQTTFISCLFIRNTETKKQWDGIYKTVKG